MGQVEIVRWGPPMGQLMTRNLAFSWWTVQWEMPKGFENKDALEVCTLERILWRSVGDLAEGEFIPVREATKEVNAVTYT